MSVPEAIMAERHRAQWLWFVVAGAFILAGLRDIYWPGFLAISGWGSGSGAWGIGAGLLILAMAVIRSVRAARTQSR
jgi:hypothetical protein